MTADTSLQVRIGIPHFFRETEGGSGYGSGRPGQRLARCLALSRCLGSLLVLRRSPSDALLHISEQRIDHWSNHGGSQQRIDRIEIELHVFTDGTAWKMLWDSMPTVFGSMTSSWTTRVICR